MSIARTPNEASKLLCHRMFPAEDPALCQTTRCTAWDFVDADHEIVMVRQGRRPKHLALRLPDVDGVGRWKLSTCDTERRGVCRLVYSQGDLPSLRPMLRVLSEEETEPA